MQIQALRQYSSGKVDRNQLIPTQDEYSASNVSSYPPKTTNMINNNSHMSEESEYRIFKQNQRVIVNKFVL